ncbi:MAG: thiamine phosphate synthase, partial [Bacteroidetes bacterium]|nr:thiamine phosphate synthase [Bacteroidota bacterium]
NISHVQQAELACQGGVKWLQFRTKKLALEEWTKTAKAIREITNKFGCKLIVNDSPNIAKSSKADGVHLGKKDMPIEEARSILGADFIIGATANNLEDILKLSTSSADYIGLGPFRFTQTKENLSPVLGEEEIKEILALKISKPIIMIGGITLSDLPQLKKLGAHGVAISSAINLSADISAEARNFVVTINDLWEA